MNHNPEGVTSIDLESAVKLNLFILLLAAQLGAQSFEVGLNFSSQTYSGNTNRNLYPTPDTANDYSQKLVYAARFGYSLFDLGSARFQFSAAYQPKVGTDLKSGNGSGLDKLSTEYFAFGGMFNFRSAVAYGAGLDVRAEKSTRTGNDTISNSYVRPWARFNVGYASTSPLIKPFLFLEVAVPVIQKDVAANLQLGIYTGVRF